MGQRGRAITTIRTVVPTVLGILAALLVMSDIWSSTGSDSFAHVLAFEAAVFAICEMLSCALVPERLLFATFSTLGGVFVGTVFNVVLYPTVNGFERNLFPLEIAFHMAVATPSMLIAAAVWRTIFYPLTRSAAAGDVHGKGDA